MDEIHVTHPVLDEAGAKAVLTIASSASSYGIPVLRVASKVFSGDFGPGDRFLNDEGRRTAGSLVAEWANAEGRTAGELEAARRFLRQWPDGPQVRE